MAALGPKISGDGRSCVQVEIEKSNFVLCSLRPNKTEQQPMDILIPEGETVRFSVSGDKCATVAPPTAILTMAQRRPPYRLLPPAR